MWSVCAVSSTISHISKMNNIQLEIEISLQMISVGFGGGGDNSRLHSIE